MDPGQDDLEIERLWRSLRDDARRRGADPSTAEDVAQDAWLQALRSPPPDRAALGGWLHVVARRVLRDRRRADGLRSWRERQSARTELGATGAPESAWPLERYVDELPAALRDVVRLRYVEDRDVAEIAARLGIHPEAVRSRLKRALAHLRTRIDGVPRERRARAVFAWMSLRKGWKAALALGGATVVAVVIGQRAERTVRVADDDGAPPRVAAAERRGMLATPREPAREAIAVVPASADAPRTPRWTGTVRAPSGTPLPHAEVSIGSEEDADANTTADESGRFELDGDGDWIWAHAEGWYPGRKTYLPSVPEGALDLFVEPTRGLVEVVVVDAAGASVPGARVSLEPYSDGLFGSARGRLELASSTESAPTDADGRTLLLFPDCARVDVLALSDLHAPARQSRDAPAPGEPFRIVLSDPARLSGTCRDSAGRAIAGARVDVRQHSGSVHRATATDADGRFDLRNLTHAGYALRAVNAAHPENGAYATGVLEIDSERELVLVLDRRATVSGRVVRDGHPVPGAIVAAVPIVVGVADGLPLRETTTGPDGTFAFPATGPVDEAIWVRGHDETTHVAGAGAEFVLELGRDARPRAPVELRFDTVGGGSLPVLAELQGRTVAVLARLDSDGRCAFDALPAGEYQVVAWSPTVGCIRAGTIAHDPLRPVAHRLVLGPPGALAVYVDLPPHTSSDSVVVSLSSAPALRLSPQRRDIGQRQLARGPQGAWEASVAPGRHMVSVYGPALAHAAQPVTVQEQERVVVRLVPPRGIEQDVVFHSPRPLGENEPLGIEALTPDGTYPLHLGPHQLVPSTYGFLARLLIPADTVELSIRSYPFGSTQAPLVGSGTFTASERKAESRKPLRIELEAER